MKRIVGLIVIMIMLFTTVCFAQGPKTINDLGYMKSNWLKTSENKTYYSLTVGTGRDDSNSGSVGSLAAYAQPNMDVYELNVLNDGIVTIEVVPLNKMYGTTTNIEEISFLSDVSGSKKRYSAADNNTGQNGIRIADFKGKGSCLKSQYLSKGTYYFAVNGSQYSTQNAAANDLVKVNYQITATMDTFAANLNSGANNPYVISGTQEVIKGILGMELHYNKSSDKFIYDTSDKIVLPAGQERSIRMTITSSGNSVLQNIDPSGKLNGFLKNSGNSMVPETKFELGYGETAVITTTLKANEKYSMELVESYPKEYTILYEELSATSEAPASQTVPITIVMTDKDTGEMLKATTVEVNGKTMDLIDGGVLNQQAPDSSGVFHITVTADGYGTQTVDKTIPYDGLNYVYVTMTKTVNDSSTVKPIIMLHTACDISPKVFDSHDYKIYVNGVDYTNEQGYMGHITNLPKSKVGDVYQVKVVVEGYEPYEETVTIPDSEYEDGNSIVFVNVNTTKSQNSAALASSSSLDSASSWAKDEIEKSIQAGLETDKMTNSNFKDNATREEFCELVVRMYEKLGGSSTSKDNPFTDTKNQEVLKAYNAGIISGTSSTTFSPNSSLTREQLCVMIIRALNASEINYNKKISFQKQYADMDDISSWAKSSVEILNGYKIINGNGETLNPKGTVTKEMAVLMMYRAYDMFQ